MSPFEHGEVFVLDDGGEADLDLGNYERFLDVTLKRDNNMTTGKVYQVREVASHLATRLRCMTVVPKSGRISWGGTDAGACCPSSLRLDTVSAKM